MENLEIQRIQIYQEEAIKNGKITNPLIQKILTNQDISSAYEDPLEVTKMILNFAVGQIPVVGGFLDLLIDLFWPSTSQDIFAQIREQVKQLVDQEIDDATWQRLDQKNKELFDKINVFTQFIKEKNWEEVHNQYISISSYFVGIEENFKITSASGNEDFYFTPLFVSCVYTVMIFRLECIRNASTFQLSASEVSAEKELLKNLILNDSGALAYVQTMYKELKDYCLDALAGYTDWSPSRFNTVAGIYKFYAINDVHPGISALWKFRANYPEQDTYINITNSYPSICFGNIDHTDSSSYYNAFINFLNNSGKDMTDVRVYCTGESTSTGRFCGGEFGFSDGSRNDHIPPYPYVVYVKSDILNLTEDDPISSIEVSYQFSTTDSISLTTRSGKNIRSNNINPQESITDLGSSDSYYKLNELYIQDKVLESHNEWRVNGTILCFITDNYYIKNNVKPNTLMKI